MSRLACERIGAGARLGSPTTGVGEFVFPGAADEAPEDSAAESGFVGFFKYAFFFFFGWLVCFFKRSREQGSKGGN